jgi:hypothetical protein
MAHVAILRGQRVTDAPRPMRSAARNAVRGPGVTTPAAAGPAPQPMHRGSLWLVLAGLMLGMFLSALDQTIVATALPTIASDIGGVGGLSWVVTDRQKMSKTHLNRLVGDGLISTDNERFRPTPWGQALVDQLRAAEHDTLAELLPDWPPEQRDELANMLNRLVNDLLGHPRDGREINRAQPQPTAT